MSISKRGERLRLGVLIGLGLIVVSFCFVSSVFVGFVFLVFGVGDVCLGGELMMVLEES